MVDEVRSTWQVSIRRARSMLRADRRQFTMLLRPAMVRFVVGDMIRGILGGLAGLMIAMPVAAQSIVEPERWYGASPQAFADRAAVMAQEIAETRSETLWKDSYRVNRLLEVAAATSDKSAVCDALSLAAEAYQAEAILASDGPGFPRSDSLFAEDDGFRLRKERLTACEAGFGQVSDKAFAARSEFARFVLDMDRPSIDNSWTFLWQVPRGMPLEEALDAQIAAAKLSARTGNRTAAIASLKEQALAHPTAYADGRGVTLRLALAEMLRNAGREVEAAELTAAFIPIVKGEIERLINVSVPDESETEIESDLFDALFALEQLGAPAAQERLLFSLLDRPLTEPKARSQHVFVGLLLVRGFRRDGETALADSTMSSIREVVAKNETPRRTLAIEEGFAAMRAGDFDRAVERFQSNQYERAGPSKYFAQQAEREVYAALQTIASSSDTSTGAKRAREIVEGTGRYAIRSRLQRSEQRAQVGDFAGANEDADGALADAAQLGADAIQAAKYTQALIAAYDGRIDRISAIRKETANLSGENARSSLCVIDVYMAVLNGADGGSVETPSCKAAHLHIAGLKERLKISREIGLGRLKAGATGPALTQLRKTLTVARTSEKNQNPIGVIAEPVGSEEFALDLLDALRADSTASRGSDSTGEAFTALQTAMVGEAARAVALNAAQIGADQAQLGSLVREFQALSKENLGPRITTYTVGEEPPEETAEEKAEELTREESLKRRAQLQGELETRFPDYFALIRPAAIEMAQAQAVLAPDEAMILAVPSPRGTHTMLVTAREARWTTSRWNAEEIDRVTTRLLSDLNPNLDVPEVVAEGWRGGTVGYAFNRKLAFELYNEIVNPVGDLLVGKRHLFIIAGGSLAALPFSTLVTQAPAGADDDPKSLRETAWFADKIAQIQLPSVQSLLLQRARATPRASGAGATFAGIGDPALSGKSLVRGGGSGGRQRGLTSCAEELAGDASLIEKVRCLSRLPGTRKELVALRDVVGGTASVFLLGDDATETNVRKADLSHADIIAFATHGLMSGEVKEQTASGEFEQLTDSALVLTPPAGDEPPPENDGLLTASEVATLRLNADWVILSACNTAKGEPNSSGLGGISRAFLYAGARNLLVSHWYVRDDVAPRITVRAISLLRDQPAISRAEAVQQAMREVRDDKRLDSTGLYFSHPNAWAPFTLVGDGAR